MEEESVESPPEDKELGKAMTKSRTIQLQLLHYAVS